MSQIILPIYHYIGELQNDNRIILYKTLNVHITWYYLKGQYEAMIDIYRTNPNAYILFVGYRHGDMQPGITGTILKMEDREKQTYILEKSENAAIRELKEEVGFTTHPNNLIAFNTQHSENVGRNATIYLTDASKCVPSKYVKISSLKDSSHKIALLVYGTRLNILDIIERAKPINPRENIAYYGSVHIVYALEMTRIIKERKAMGQIGTFRYCI